MTQAIDVTAEQRRTILALLNRHLPGTTVWACGSRVKWTSRPESDLDLVAFARPEQSARVADLREAFEESDLPFRVDLFVWDETPESFRARIEADHVVLVDAASDRKARENWLYHPRFPAHWGRRPLYSMAQWVNGLAFRNIKFSADGRPVIKIAEIKGGISDQTKFTNQNFDESVHVRAGDLLFSWSGQPETSIDAFWWRGPEGWLNQHIFRVTPLDGVNTVFFFYLLRYLKPNFVAIARNKQTTGLGHVTKHDLENIKAALPEIHEQRVIAHVLGTLDDKIELNRRMNETLEAMARALFKSWFVDFDPVRARMEGRDTGLPRQIADLFPDRFVDSECGEIPAGWKAGRLADIASLNPESWNARNSPENMVYVDLANTKWGQIEKVELYSWRNAPSRARRVLRTGDTVIGTVRPGNGSFALIGRDGLTGSTGFAVLRPHTSNDREIVWCAATSRDNLDRLAHLADGGAYPAVRPQAVTGTRVVLADLPVRRAFSSMAAPWVEQIERNGREGHTLAGIRDTLLPKLVSGELRTENTTGLPGGAS